MGNEIVKVFDYASMNEKNFSECRNILREMVDRSVNGVKRNFLEMGYFAWLSNKRLSGKFVWITFNHCTSDVIDYLQRRHGLSKSTVYAAIKCFENFCEETERGSFRLKEEYSSYSQSQLVELLPMSAEERGKVTPEMSVKEIRAIKKQSKAVKPKEPEQLVIEETSEEFSGRPENEPPEKKEPVVIKAPEPDHDTLVERAVARKKVLPNDAKRKEWIRNYEKWGVWISVPDLNMTYYRYDVDDKVAFIVSVVLSAPKPWKPDGKDERWHLCDLVDGKPDVFSPGGCALSVLTEYLQKHASPVIIFE